MTEKGQYPLVYQLENRNGTLIPVGLAETSSLGSFSAVNIVVSSISATDYLGFESNVSFTGVLSVQSTGTGAGIVILTDPNNPVIRSIITPTDGFLDPGIAGDGSVQIGWGGYPLGYDHGGTNSADIPVANGVAHWYSNGGSIFLDTEVDFTFNKTNLSIPSDGKYQIGGNDLKLADIAGITSPNTLNNIPEPTTNDTYLVYKGGIITWSAVTGTGTGTTNPFPNDPGRIPVTNSETQLDTYADFTYASATKTLNTYAINNVCDVCAIRIIEGGTLLSEKYQGKDDTLTTIASLNPGANELIYFTNTNVAATTSVTPCGLELLNDATFADMRTTLELNSYYQPIGAYLTAIPSEYLTEIEGNGLYQTCDVLLQTISDQGYIDLETGDVDGVLPVTKGGTSKNLFNSNQLIYGEFSQDANLTYTSNTLKSPTVCATTVCATTILEGGESLPSKYLTQVNATTTYQSKTDFNTFTGTLGDLAFTASVDLNSTQVYNSLPVTKGGTGLTTISNNQIVVGNGSDSIGTITTPTDGTYLKYNTAGGFSWSLIPTGTGTTLPSQPCGVVFMNTASNELAANPAITVDTANSVLVVSSNADTEVGGLDLYPNSTTEGITRWDPIYHTLGVQGSNDSQIRLGVDEIIPVTNNTGSEIKKGQVCYVSGSSGGSLKGTISLLSTATPDPFVLGVALTTIAAAGDGYLIKKGLIRNAAIAECITGTTPSVGDILYVSDQAGKLTKTAPTAGNHAATVGIVLHVDGNISFGVSIDKGYDLADLHDVCAVPNDGETLVWDAAQSYYTVGTINDITGTLAVNKGGTGKTSFTANQLIFGDDFSQNANLYYSNNVLNASAVSSLVVSSNGSVYGGNASLAGSLFVLGGNITTAGFVLGASMSATDFFEGGINIDQIYQPIGNYQPNSTRLHELTAVTVDGLLRFNGSNYVTQPTSTYETTAYSRTNFATIASLDNYTPTSTHATLVSNLQDLAYLDQVNLTTTSVTGTLDVTKGGTGLTNLTVGSFLVGNGTSVSLTPTATFETTANAASVYLTKATYNTFTGTLQDLAYLDQVNLTTTSVTGTLPISNGGTAKTSFNNTQLIYGQFSQNANLTFDETVLKSPTVCGTTVCGTTLVESGQSIASKYLTQANAALTYQVTSTRLHELTAVSIDGLLRFNGSNYITQPTSTYETTANAIATYLSKTNFNTWSGSLALSSGLGDVVITTPSNGQVLKWNGSKWANGTDNTGTGGGTPGGNDTHVQVNFEGEFSGNAGLTYNLDTSTLRAQFYSNLPSGDPIWNANQLSGYPIVSGFAVTGGPQFGDILSYFTTGVGAPINGWYWTQNAAAAAGGNNTEIQFNNGGAFSGSPALIWQNSTSSLISKQLSATTVSAGTIHVGGSDGYIRNNNGSIGISSIGGSVSISGTGSVSLQGLQVNAAAWPEAGSNNGVVFYSDAGNSLLIARLNGQALNGSRDYFGSQPQGYLVASYLGSSTPAMQIDPYYATNFGPTLPNNPQNKEVLVYNTNLYNLAVSAWTWEGLSLAGGYLSDVSAVAATTSNQALVYDTTGAKWKPGYTITYGTANPTGGNDGDIYLQYT